MLAEAFEMKAEVSFIIRKFVNTIALLKKNFWMSDRFSLEIKMIADS
ncbi:hypothetical protein [Nostoc sphaeroides]|uniref:Uncharacterized protein n=1 Tax=Nostoc sphaeroides CCNUC1 TaxID=2653204 RepID=A0A5P8W8V5_9NOSO|nr:hypothetical protein [Nostoc sphaeroides]MCC5627375.1 hypothetical protein [Nostoc sphaeroides CHAB 2801]QFS49227.1 hypothetical protein GXM_06721 [Nostoc sphaeroides CCNUC1]